MSQCNYIPSSDSIYVIGETADNPVSECKKAVNSKGETNYLCDGNIQGNFWKFSPGTKGNNNTNSACRWFGCKNPFVRRENNTIDTNDYGDCLMTNFPYVIENHDSTCMVHDVFTGETREQSCNNGTNCCRKGSNCDALDCMGYKAIDTYLIDGIRKYSCKEGSCVEVEPGSGQYSNPYCDYECLNQYYPTVYNCLNGVCQYVGPDKGVYDNAECDAQCPLDPNTKFVCKAQSDGTSECVVTNDPNEKGATDWKTCYATCQDAGGIIPDVKEEVNKTNYIFIIFLIINIILLFFLMNR